MPWSKRTLEMVGPGKLSYNGQSRLARLQAFVLFSEANMRLLSRVEEEVDFFSIGRRVIVVYVERIRPDFYYQLPQPDIKIITHIYPSTPLSALCVRKLQKYKNIVFQY